MTDTAAIKKIKAEIENAHTSHQKGNEGRARVCARRAAGWAVQEHLKEKGIELGHNNALDHLKHFATLEGHTPQMYETLKRLTVKLEKDSLESDAYYPIEGVDIIQEAVWLVKELLGVELG